MLNRKKPFVILTGLLLSIIVSLHAAAAGLDLGSLGSLLGDMDTSALYEMLLGAGSSQGSGSSSSGSASSSGAGDSSAAGAGMDLLMGMLGITNRAMKDCTVSKISDQTYTGSAITPTPVVKYNGTRLKRGTDYTAAYNNNTKVGTAKITLKGKGNYTGTKTVSFRIVRKGSSGGSSSSKGNSSPKGSSSSKNSSKSKGKTSSKGTSKTGGNTTSKSRNLHFTVKLTEASCVYNGKVRKPSVKVTVRGKTIPGANYTVTYKNNKSVGRATVTVKEKGDYKGYTGESTFKITLKKTSLTGVSSAGDGKATCRWNADSQAEGYQISYATNKTFKNAKTAKVEGGSKKTAEIGKLTPGKTWYFRIRSYKKVGFSNWYSEWSAAKSVKVK